MEKLESNFQDTYNLDVSGRIYNLKVRVFDQLVQDIAVIMVRLYILDEQCNLNRTDVQGICDKFLEDSMELFDILVTLNCSDILDGQAQLNSMDVVELHRN